MEDMVRVGVVKGQNKVFISVPDAAYEKCKLPITKSNAHTMKFSYGDLEWLIRALKKELRNHNRITVKEPA